ncbi:hypothetical protein QTN47_14485 [Danxiaibacter flavus]|uniref:Uncharacterized protein n=1 Tax=Danxiaibacter flavus TaxID=3049108 RepID=A0ABV3ZI19_9BACT|nr:hypothetical protein QNM32_14490 [Chitinophagaceae bacterium DXS]
MIKILVLATILFSAFHVQAQEDYVVLRKGNKTIQRFTSGSYIDCRLDNYQWMSGYITAIRHDSLFIRQFQVRTIGSISDTSTFGIFPIHINDIKAFPKQPESFEFIKNGTLFMIGGGGYAVLNIANGLINNEEVFSGDNLTKLGIALGVAGIGVIMNVTHSDVIKVGKKYRLQYVKLNP